METGANKRTKEKKGQDFMEFLKEKKAKDGRLSKFGEWLLKNGGMDEDVYYDMNAVMK